MCNVSYCCWQIMTSATVTTCSLAFILLVILPLKIIIGFTFSVFQGYLVQFKCTESPHNVYLLSDKCYVSFA